MSDSIEFTAKSIGSQREGLELLEQVVEVADAAAVFSEPHTAGDYVVVTAAELAIGLGYGYGGGGSAMPTPTTSDEPEPESAIGFGTGGGGGGGSIVRPIAAIEIGPNGVRVEPIVDPTKIALAFFTMLLSMMSMLAKLRKATR